MKLNAMPRKAEPKRAQINLRPIYFFLLSLFFYTIIFMFYNVYIYIFYGNESLLKTCQI